MLSIKLQMTCPGDGVYRSALWRCGLLLGADGECNDTSLLGT
jgi:hypothetical protein